MLLAIDIGNTSTSFAVFNKIKIKKFFYLDTEKILEQKFLKKQIQKHTSNVEIKALAISSVVPKTTPILKKTIRKVLGNTPSVDVSTQVKTGLSFKVDNPREVGADRIANCVAAHHLIKKDVIIVDFGTATTFDVLTKNGVYVGGLIYPGIETSFSTLFQKAAQLRAIKLKKPRSLIVKN